MIKLSNKDNNNQLPQPKYVSISILFMALVLLVYINYVGKTLIVPFIFATLIAALLNPLVNFFVRKKINRIVAICFSIFLAIVFIVGLIYTISSQISLLSESFPQLTLKFRTLLNHAMDYTVARFNISEQKINEWIDHKQAEMLNNSGAAISYSLSQVGGFLLNIIILPVYVFLILYYKTLLIQFIHKLFNQNKGGKVGLVLQESQSIIQTYLVGLLIEAGIVAVLNITGLLIIGVQYAILFGLIGAVLNLIPYIGIVIAAFMPITIALLLQSPTHALFVILLYGIVQFVDNNVIVPRVVASKVKINALMSIIVVLIGGAIWGIAGMFLSIPIAAIAKVIFDKVTELKPFGYLLGDTIHEHTIVAKEII